MKIGFDISQTGSAKAGCGYFADGLIRQLTAEKDCNEYLLYPAVGDFFWDPDYSTSTFRSDRSEIARWIPPENFEACSRFWRTPADDFEAELGSPDIFHSNNFYCPQSLRKARLIYTLYDLSFIQNPDWNTEANRVGCFAGVFRARLFADLILAISDYTRQHFLSTFPAFPENRITVLYPASRFEGQSYITVPKRFNTLKPNGFWLSVGTIEPRKNYTRLLEAYRILRTEKVGTLPLLLVGAAGWLPEHFEATLRGLGPDHGVILPGYVSDEELGWLYQNCFGFVYPSLFEGFGMPVLEALGLGAPVLCSNSSSLPEVAGDAAILFDPLDPRSIAAGMRRLASGEISRELLRTSGNRQAAKFSWKASASRLLTLYRHVMDSPHAAKPYLVQK